MDTPDWCRVTDLGTMAPEVPKALAAQQVEEAPTFRVLRFVHMYVIDVFTQALLPKLSEVQPSQPCWPSPSALVDNHHLYFEGENPIKHSLQPLAFEHRKSLEVCGQPPCIHVRCSSACAGLAKRLQNLLRSLRGVCLAAFHKALLQFLCGLSRVLTNSECGFCSASLHFMLYGVCWLRA